MHAVRIGHVEFEVGDLPRMIAYYTDLVGLTVTGRDAATPRRRSFPAPPATSPWCCARDPVRPG